MRRFAPPSRGQLVAQTIRALLDGALAESRVGMRRPMIETRSTFGGAGLLQLIHCDRLQLQQALAQIITNAADAMPNGGSLSIHTTATHDQIAIAIGDTGPGIPPDVAPHIFEPFFTTRPGRSGLGLATSAEIVAQHGGQLTIAATGPSGTLFRVVLPWTPPAAD